MDIVVTVAIVAALFLLTGLAEPLAARLRLPFSVILAGIGILIGAGAAWFLATELTDALNPVALVILEFPITSGIFLYGFLPTLLFQATIGMNVRRMADDWVPILVLAIVAVILATLSVGYALHWTAGLPLMACLLLGAIISTTDPSAVVSIFRSIAAPQRLARIVEGESLLNDAAAIALFGIFIGFVMRGVPDPDLVTALLDFPLILAGGALTGWVLARLTGLLLVMLSPFATAQITATVALPYLAFIIAEQIVGASGSSPPSPPIDPLHRRTGTAVPCRLDTVAGYLGPAGPLVRRLHLRPCRNPDSAPSLHSRCLRDRPPRHRDPRHDPVTCDRALGTSPRPGRPPALPARRQRLSRRHPLGWPARGRDARPSPSPSPKTPSSPRNPPPRRCAGHWFRAFHPCRAGHHAAPCHRAPRLDRLSPIDAALANQVVATALQSVREDVATATENYGLSRETVRAEAKAFGERLDSAVRAADESEALLDRDRITLGLIALAGFEREMILDRFRDRAISGRLAEIALSDADRLIEMTRTDGRTGYRRAARAELGQGGTYGLAIRLHNRLRLSGPLQSLTADGSN